MVQANKYFQFLNFFPMMMGHFCWSQFVILNFCRIGTHTRSLSKYTTNKELWTTNRALDESTSSWSHKGNIKKRERKKKQLENLTGGLVFLFCFLSSFCGFDCLFCRQLFFFDLGGGKGRVSLKCIPLFIVDAGPLELFYFFLSFWSFDIKTVKFPWEDWGLWYLVPVVVLAST